MPGVGLAAIAKPLIGAGISALGGLFGGNKQKQTNTVESNSTTNNTQNTSFNNNSSQNRTFDENPAFMQAREALLGQMAQAFGQANKPLYGQQQQAAFMGDVNQLTQAAMQRLRSQMGSSGAFNSGRFAGGATDLQKNALNQIVDFNSKIPVMNRQYADQQKNGLMQLASSWLGLGPVNETITGQQSGTQETKGTSETKGTQTQTGTVGGQGGWQGALGGLLGFGGGLLGDVVGGNAGGWFGRGGGGINPIFNQLPLNSQPNAALNWFRNNPIKMPGSDLNL